ncbi:N5,N10-methylene tetrahydromethanopterin reductase [Gordonia sp. CPCC 206044]|uniref:N5,N10-methylene tetrahydromethanopterin reductase n=1 Tax=Gordonia sp. CPCC 206044 TaxID=3140793 RepID=UPI003AF3D585
MAAPFLALGLTGRAVLQLLDDSTLVAEWDALPLAFTILGVDRFDGRVGRAQPTIDSSAAAAVLAARTTSARTLVAAAPRRDHPYNLARRVASLGHLSAGRTGAVFGLPDSDVAIIDPWVASGTVADRSAAAHHVASAARAVRALERSWPLESVVGERDSGIFVRSGQIDHVDIDETYRIAGPLTVPEPPHGPSVLAWYGDPAADGVPDVADDVDLVIGSAGQPIVAIGLGDEVPTDATGTVLSAAVDGGDVDVADLLHAARQLLADGVTATDSTLPLRDALTLAIAPRVPRRAAFPVPQPHPWL